MILAEKLKNLQKGFTIVELLVATVVISLVLMGAMAALVQVGRLYYKGITTARTQDRARGIISELSESIQFSAQDITAANPPIAGPDIPITLNDPAADTASVTSYLCVGLRRYTFAIDRKLALNPDDNPVVASRRKESRHVLWVDEPVGGCRQNNTVTAADLTLENPCDPSGTPADTTDDVCRNGRELLAENMRLSKFSIVQNPGTATFSIALSIAYGDDDLLSVNSGRYVCEGSSVGSEFCAIAELSTTVLKRI